MHSGKITPPCLLFGSCFTCGLTQLASSIFAKICGRTVRFQDRIQGAAQKLHWCQRLPSSLTHIYTFTYTCFVSLPSPSVTASTHERAYRLCKHLPVTKEEIVRFQQSWTKRSPPTNAPCMCAEEIGCTQGGNKN